ncbi:hypothetical protein Tco_0184797 [Tanacetum coccineum]
MESVAVWWDGDEALGMCSVLLRSGFDSMKYMVQRQERSRIDSTIYDYASELATRESYRRGVHLEDSEKLRTLPEQPYSASKTRGQNTGRAYAAGMFDRDNTKDHDRGSKSTITTLGPCASKFHNGNRLVTYLVSCKTPKNANSGANSGGGNVDFEMWCSREYQEDCPKLKNKQQSGVIVDGNTKAPKKVYPVGKYRGKRRNNVVTVLSS